MAATEIDVARETIDCFNAGDWERMRALHAPDCVQEELATERRVEGFDAMLDIAQGWKRAFPDGRGTVLGAYSDGSTAILEIQWEGTNSGPMEGPGGEQMPATGKRARVKACQVLEVEDGRVKSVRHYFNLSTIMTQLGVSAPGAAAVA